MPPALTDGRVHRRKATVTLPSTNPGQTRAAKITVVSMVRWRDRFGQVERSSEAQAPPVVRMPGPASGSTGTVVPRMPLAGS